MQVIDINYSGFELIYRNTYSLNHTYDFITVLPFVYNSIGPVFESEGKKYVLEISTERLNRYHYLSKEECVSQEITGKYKIFNNDTWYLYKHDGKYGKYHINTQTFVAFDGDVANKVHAFYYEKMSF